MNSVRDVQHLSPKIINIVKSVELKLIKMMKFKKGDRVKVLEAKGNHAYTTNHKTFEGQIGTILRGGGEHGGDVIASTLIIQTSKKTYRVRVHTLHRGSFVQLR